MTDPKNTIIATNPIGHKRQFSVLIVSRTGFVTYLDLLPFWVCHLLGLSPIVVLIAYEFVVSLSLFGIVSLWGLSHFDGFHCIMGLSPYTMGSVADRV